LGVYTKIFQLVQLVWSVTTYFVWCSNWTRHEMYILLNFIWNIFYVQYQMK